MSANGRGSRQNCFSLGSDLPGGPAFRRGLEGNSLLCPTRLGPEWIEYISTRNLQSAYQTAFIGSPYKGQTKTLNWRAGGHYYIFSVTPLFASIQRKHERIALHQ